MDSTTDRYAAFDCLLFDRPAPHVLRVTINNPDKLNALVPAAHRQFETLWAAIDEDPETRVSIVTGAGRAFCAGGSLDDMPVAALDPAQTFSKGFAGAGRLVAGLINARKPIVSAINGPAIGAGLAIALLADIPIAARQAKLLDGHLRIGVVPGDHAALVWPLLCGMAKAKYFLMTNTTMTGEEAERHNLVALAVDAADLQDKALEVASQLAATAPTALRMTKYVLNHWLRQQQPIFDLSLAFEMANFSGAEARKAMEAMGSKTQPDFDDEVFF
jgi:enoyl-CoA hydratase/carnithine racemase